MIRRILGVAVLTGLVLTMSGPTQADISIGADLVSRYVWRGTDFGNALTVQPGIDYDAGSGINIGAWSSWAVNSGSANENDLYISYAPTDKISITVTDYYFPTGDSHHSKLNGNLSGHLHGPETEDQEDLHIDGTIEGTIEKHDEPKANDDDDFLNADSHIVELSASIDLGAVSILGAINVHGDKDDDEKSRNSFYAEIGLPLSALSSNDVDVSLSAGFGDGVYVTGKKGDPALVVVGLNASNDNYSASYIVNPDSELSFLVIGKTF